MAIHITPAILEAAYELLRQTPPFRGWRLPDPDELEFRAVPLENGDQGELYTPGDGTIRLSVNPARHMTLYALLMTVAHEMVHIRQHKIGARDHHGESFQKMAATVCRRHGFDRGQF